MSAAQKSQPVSGNHHTARTEQAGRTRAYTLARRVAFLVTVAGGLLCTAWRVDSADPESPAKSQSESSPAAAANDARLQPVETDMHEFMEYMFQPVYRRLKASMADTPADNAGWKQIKSDSLILAEACNLLATRAPEKNSADWSSLSAAVRTEGAELYRAAKRKDYGASRQHYQAMLVQCNQCHNEFADGEHQLEP